MICAPSCRCHAYRGPLTPQHSEVITVVAGKPVSAWVWTHCA